MFRIVDLPEGTKGTMYLHSMPGRREPLDEAKRTIRQLGIQRVVSLAPLSEIKVKSPEYARAIQNNDIDWEHESFPIEDYGVPLKRDDFFAFSKKIAGFIISGEKILIHCGAGIGRTGTLAVAILMILGESMTQAIATVERAESHSETTPQKELINWIGQNLENHDEVQPS